jgi:hypothetical protein
MKGGLVAFTRRGRGKDMASFVSLFGISIQVNLVEAVDRGVGF